MEWIEQALDVQTIAKCRERVEGRLAPRLPPAGGSARITIEASFRASNSSVPPPKLQYGAAAVHLYYIHSSPAPDTDSAVLR